LWKVFYEDLLETDMPPGVQLEAFADDVAVIGISRTGSSTVDLLNPALDTVVKWMRDNGLKVAPQKSEAVVLTRKHKYDNPLLYVEGLAIPVKPAIRELSWTLLVHHNSHSHRIQEGHRRGQGHAWLCSVR